MARPLRAVTIKRRLAIIMLATEIVVFVWRIKVPTILDSFGIANLIYLLLVLSFLPIVTAMGWYGAKLTFPIEEE